MNRRTQTADRKITSRIELNKANQPYQNALLLTILLSKKFNDGIQGKRENCSIVLIRWYEMRVTMKAVNYNIVMMIILCYFFACVTHCVYKRESEDDDGGGKAACQFHVLFFHFNE